jgi:putative addiction module component (TIGR02574 family)
MASRAERVLTEALRLPPNARASVAGSLILSLETDSDAGVEEAWAAEVDRRLAAFPQDKKRAVAWSTVRARIARARRAHRP